MVLLQLVAYATALATTPAQAAPAAGDPSSSVSAEVRSAHEVTAAAAQAAHDAAEAAKSAAEAAQSTAQAVHELAGHVEDLEHAEPSVAPALPRWGYQLGINALAKAGNAANFSGQTNVGVDGRYKQWATELRLRAAYGIADAVGDTGERNRQVTTYNGTASARGERFYTPFLGNYVLLRGATDHVASIRYQATGELGLTLVWWEIERDGYLKSKLRTSIGVGVTRESRRQYYPTQLQLPGRWIYGPPVTLNYYYALARGTYFSEDLEVLYNINSAADVRLNSQTTLAAAIADHVSLSVNFAVRYIGQPAEDRKSTDTELGAGLSFTF